MNFFKILFIIIYSLIANVAFADNHDQKQEVLDAAKEIVKEMEEDEEVPLNDPFAGNEGTSSSASIPQDEQDNDMSLYNFKLAGLISGQATNDGLSSMPGLFNQIAIIGSCFGLLLILISKPIQKWVFKKS